MQKQSWERWWTLLSSLLLGAGLGCVLCLVPSPLRLLVCACLAPLLPLGACLGCGLGASGLLLLKWAEHRSIFPETADEPLPLERGSAATLRVPHTMRWQHGLTFLRVRHAWRVVQPAPADVSLVEETSGIPCHRCGVPAPRAALLRCTYCSHLFHPTCCRWIADGREANEMLCQRCWNEQMMRRRPRAFPAAGWPILARRPAVDGRDEPGKGGQ